MLPRATAFQPRRPLAGPFWPVIPGFLFHSLSKPVSRRAHAFTAYSYVPLVSAAPDLMGFTDEKTATTLCYVLSSTTLVSNCFTRAEWGSCA
jgi:hypothetical protein